MFFNVGHQAVLTGNVSVHMTSMEAGISLHRHIFIGGRSICRHVCAPIAEGYSSVRSCGRTWYEFCRCGDPRRKRRDDMLRHLLQGTEMGIAFPRCRIP